MFFFFFPQELIFFYALLYWKRSVYINFFRKGNKDQPKPIYILLLTSSEAVMNYVWYQATFSIIAFQKCTLNCLIFQIVLAL